MKSIKILHLKSSQLSLSGYSQQFSNFSSKQCSPPLASNSLKVVLCSQSAASQIATSHSLPRFSEIPPRLYFSQTAFSAHVSISYELLPPFPNKEARPCLANAYAQQSEAFNFQSPTCLTLGFAGLFSRLLPGCTASLPKTSPIN